MFDSILNAAFSIIFGLFLIAMLWNVMGDIIKSSWNFCSRSNEER